MIKKLLFISFSTLALLAVYLVVKRSVPHKEQMQTRLIIIDSIGVAGPVVFIYDKPSRENFWLKSYTTLDPKEFDSLINRQVRIHYMKVFAGPFENRIFKIDINSVVIFDQGENE